MEDISLLNNKYKFELIPKCQAVKDAGYTKEKRLQAQCWYSPIIKDKYIYYTAWYGGILTTNHLSSILVCRKLSNGKLIYAINCQDYNLDTAPNFLGDSTTICRTRPAIYKDTIYLCNAIISNIGPQIYAIDRNNGKLKWALAYYTPIGAPSTISTKGNYSMYTGSNMRISDLNILVKSGYLFIGTSSFQNSLNVGVMTTGFPIYTDQGFLFCIQDQGCKGKIMWKVPTCAPLLKVGDSVIQSIMNGASQTICESFSSSDNYFIQPYYINDTTPVAAYVSFNKSTSITPSLVQPMWSITNIQIHQDSDKTTSYNINQLVSLWKNEQSNLPLNGTAHHIIWSYVDSTIMNNIIGQNRNINVMYFKYYTYGQTINNSYDAQSLNYWGNSVWGNCVKYDKTRKMIYFSTGQSHSMPLDEAMYYNDPSRNFKILVKPVIDAEYSYKNGQISVNEVNKIKDLFTKKIRREALNNKPRSPRGKISYSDSIFGINVRDGTINFVQRIVPWDMYSFLNTPSLSVYPFDSLDGDLSSGIFQYKNYLASAAKSGVTPILKWDNDRVVYKKLIFCGPSGVFGGANYMSGHQSRYLISNQANMSWFGGSSTMKGLEFYVTRDGRVFDINNSYIQSIDIKKGEIKWEKYYGSRTNSQILCWNNLIFSVDGNGSLYVFDLKTGSIKWKYDGKVDGLNGGILAPQISKDGKIVWLNNYSVFGNFGSSGPSGAVYDINKSLKINENNMFYNRKYQSWDTFPKLGDTLIPSIEPVNNVLIGHKWSNYRVQATHKIINPPSVNTYYFKMGNDLKFKKSKYPNIKYKLLRLINKNIYQLFYSTYENGEWIKNWAWFRYY